MNHPEKRWGNHAFLAACLGQLFCIQILIHSFHRCLLGLLIHSFMHALIDSFIRYMLVGSSLYGAVAHIPHGYIRIMHFRQEYHSKRCLLPMVPKTGENGFKSLPYHLPLWVFEATQILWASRLSKIVKIIKCGWLCSLSQLTWGDLRLSGVLAATELL